MLAPVLVGMLVRAKAFWFLAQRATPVRIGAAMWILLVSCSGSWAGTGSTQVTTWR